MVYIYVAVTCFKPCSSNKRTRQTWVVALTYPKKSGRHHVVISSNHPFWDGWKTIVIWSNPQKVHHWFYPHDISMCSPSFPWSNPHFPSFEPHKQRRWIDLTWTKNCTISKCPSKAASPSGVAPWRCRLARWNWIILSHSPGIESFWGDPTCILHVTCNIIYSDVGQWTCYNFPKNMK